MWTEDFKSMGRGRAAIFSISIFSDWLPAVWTLCDDNTNSSSFLNQIPPTSACHICAWWAGEGWWWGVIYPGACIHTRHRYSKPLFKPFCLHSCPQYRARSAGKEVTKSSVAIPHLKNFLHILQSLKISEAKIYTHIYLIILYDKVLK